MRRYLWVIGHGQGRGETAKLAVPEMSRSPTRLTHQEMIMKTLILTATLVTSILAGALTASAAERKVPFDAAKFFAEQSNRSGQ
jgi:hypothetical protein